MLNLGQGFPDFHPAEHVTAALAKICSNSGDPLLHQYTRSYVRIFILSSFDLRLQLHKKMTTQGHKRLVDALAKMYGKLINREINPMTEVLVTVGAYG